MYNSVRILLVRGIQSPNFLKPEYQQIDIVSNAEDIVQSHAINSTANRGLLGLREAQDQLSLIQISYVSYIKAHIYLQICIKIKTIHAMKYVSLIFAK